MSGGRSWSWKHSYSNVAELHVVTVILESDVPFTCRSVKRPLVELGFRHAFFPVRASELVVEQFYSIQPVLDAISLRDNSSVIPFTGRMHDSARCWIESIVRACRCERILSVVVTRIVEDLHFRRGLPDRIRLLDCAVKNAAVAFRGNFPVEREIEVFEFIQRDDIARCGICAHQRAVDDSPSAGNRRLAEIAPAGCRLSVEKKAPSKSPFAAR